MLQKTATVEYMLEAFTLGLSYVYTVYQVSFSSVAALYNNLYEVHID